MTAITEALPEFELAEDTLAGKEQSKRQKSPPGDDVSVIVLSSDNASGDESVEETVDTTKPRQIKTEPISTEIGDAAANDSTAEGAAPRQALVSDGDDAQRHNIEHQSEDSDADDEESVQGHDSEPDVTDVDEGEHQYHSSEQSVRKEPSASNAVDNPGDEAHKNACKRIAHATDVADNDVSDDDADDVASNESGEESDTPSADEASSELHEDTKVFVSALKQIHELVEDLSYRVLAGKVAVNDAMVKQAMTVLHKITMEAKSVVSKVVAKRSPPLLPDIVAQLSEILPAPLTEPDATASPRTATATPPLTSPTKDVKVTAATTTATIRTSISAPNDAAEASTSQARPTSPTIKRAYQRLGEDTSHKRPRRMDNFINLPQTALPADADTLQTMLATTDDQQPSLKRLSWHTMANNAVFAAAHRFVRTLKPRPMLSTDSAEDTVHMLRIISRHTYRASNGCLYGPFVSTAHQAAYLPGYRGKPTWLFE